MMDDYKSMIRGLSKTKINHIFREGNLVVNDVSNERLCCYGQNYWNYSNLPHLVKEKVTK